ncbi:MULTISPECIES: DUF1566 domain-containing protein [unclassified Pseudomonas]|uniref:DUF1566 domain-containing protein n=1 Tax=unclassified Pseudomonas TaxID=196821 RepID=UPI001B333210|nr:MULTISPECIES: DUF1566 domain-containing protein [unclassified Pseudomonas]MBP5948497.1 DUF1566 domain-containing protein [Pseudomonas sp. P9(2020)]MBZ9560775.1 DUF1566 domain-containing protein [Pseudomonas sp. P116]
MQTNQLTTYTSGDLMISSPDESVVLKLASLAIAAAPVTSASGIPAVGEIWPGEGGVNGGLFPGDGKPYYLIVPTGADAEGEFEWGGYGNELNGAKSAWDGRANTDDLIGADDSYPAAQFCAAFEREGHKDFHLMSRREASFLEVTLGDKDVFSKRYHWTSSQFSADTAYTMAFADGWPRLLGKYYERVARPVRRRFI